jgi:hypothetical protein
VVVVEVVVKMLETIGLEEAEVLEDIETLMLLKHQVEEVQQKLLILFLYWNTITVTVGAGGSCHNRNLQDGNAGN